jgi:hypothetical protein
MNAAVSQELQPLGCVLNVVVDHFLHQGRAPVLCANWDLMKIQHCTLHVCSLLWLPLVLLLERLPSLQLGVFKFTF